jgi:hypothetical protein
MKKRRVIIGTPCYDGRLDVWYVNSLSNTIKQSALYNVEIVPIWISFDALLQKARNDTVHLALADNVDDLIWIDSDIEWNPEWIFQLLNYNVDVVGGTYPKKGDREEYVVRKLTTNQPDPGTGLISVTGLGTGFVRWSRRAIQYLWDTSEPYVDSKDGLERRFIFDVVIENHSLVSEDIHAFDKLRQGGFEIWLDPAMTCNHTGHKKWQGDFNAWLKNGKKPTWENSAELEKMSELARYSIDQRPPMSAATRTQTPPMKQNLVLNTTPRRQL